MPSEFELIDRVFRRAGRPLRQTVLGIGDDAALLRPSAGCELAVSTDLLVEGTHFLPDTDPEDLGWKTLAVNLSDMAAMGAQPRWATLSIALPAADIANAAVPPRLTFGESHSATWIEAFATGFFACADTYGVDLIGGDTTRGPRAFCVGIYGEVPAGEALLRSGAQAGDAVWVSGVPGRAALGLAILQGRLVLAEPQRSECIAALQRPQPRVELGLALRGLATAAIDVSDGLLADLGHILEESGLAAELQLPAGGPGMPAPHFDLDAYLAGGDDYELVFTAPPATAEQVAKIGKQLGLPLTCLGRVVAGAPGALRVLSADGCDVTPARRGFDHFAP